MSKLKIAELIIGAITAIIAIAKAVVKLINYVSKLKQKPKAVAV